MKATLSINGIRFPVSPSGLAGIKVSYKQESGQAFYRKKLSGSLDFSGDDFARVSLMQDCCQTANLAIYGGCSSAEPILTPRLKSGEFSWNFATCSAKTESLEVIDLYAGVFRLWEKKINVLRLPANVVIKHKYRKATTINGATTYTFPFATNERFRSWSALVFYLIQETFKGSAFESITPTISTYSTFFTAPINPVDKLPNLFLRSAICQASDMVEPLSASSATGVLASGKDNESMTMSLKDVLENLYAMFDCEWLIDPLTGKFRIEHRLYFDNGFSYESPTLGLNLKQPHFADVQARYYGNYKLKTDELFGTEELLLEGNVTLNKSKFAYPFPFTADDFTDGFGIVDDFDFGNIRYDTPCAGKDDKGTPLKSTRTASLFYTMLESVRLADEAIDRTKWFLVEYEPAKPSFFDDLFAALKLKRGGTIANSLAERRNIVVANANFSATALMRSFHRHGRSFRTGLMNFNDAVLAEKGVNREMYSVKPTKLFDRITIPYCCDDPEFNPYADITLPDGQIGRVVSAEYVIGLERMDIDLVSASTCTGVIVTPNPSAPVEYPTRVDPTTGENRNFTTKPNYGKESAVRNKVRTELIDVICSVATDLARGEYRDIPYKAERTYFADGFGGEYYADTDPCPNNN